MAKAHRSLAFSMRVTVVSIFIFLSITTVILALSLQYYFSQALAKDAVNTQFTHISQAVSERVFSIDTESQALVELLAAFPTMGAATDLRALHPASLAMAKSMGLKNYLYAIYVGYENGDFYELINLNNSADLRESLNATTQDRWLVVKILNTAAGRQRIHEYYDETFTLRHKDQQSSSFLANDRPWYRDAQLSPNVIKTAPYLFHNQQTPGVTYAKNIPNSGAVVAIDISLATQSDFLKQQRFLPSSEAMIFEADGTLVAHSFDVAPPQQTPSSTAIALTDQEKAYIKEIGKLRVSNELNWPPFDFSYGGEPYGYSIDFVNLLADKIGLEVKYVNGYSWDSLIELFHQRKIDLVHSIFYSAQRESWGIFTTPYLKLPCALVTLDDKTDITAFSSLVGKTIAIPKGWYLEEFIQANYPEITILPVVDSLSSLQAVANGQAYGAIETRQVVDYLSQTYFLEHLKIHPQLPELETANLSLNIMVHSDQTMLADILNRAINAITPKERSRLNQVWADRNTSNSMQHSFSAGIVPHKQFVELAKEGRQNGSAQALLTLNGQTYLSYVQPINSMFDSNELLGIMVPLDDVMAPYMTKINMSVMLTLLLLVTLTPLMLYFSNTIVRPVNALAKENEKIKKRDFTAVKPVSSNITEFIELSESMNSMATSIEDYQRSQQELLDSFIRLIAQAIDEKSPYTGGHCERVPELALMLAKAASTSQLPAFQNFEINNDDQWREFKIAAWLHDCGKVTTPEHIVDKGSKLETIYNRIHEIRTRFEVLWRDAEIVYWKGVAQGQPEAQLKLQLCQRQEQINDQFTFIANCNVGSERMDDAYIERIKQIGAQTWTRHLDNRLGLSPEETRRFDMKPQALPAIETLLVDTPDHLVQWPKRPEHPEKFKFDMQPPEYQANLGEIYNLCIRSGTLTNEDRYRINEHVIATIRMLEELPLPEDLARVPEFAGGHHETLIGTGYPRKLSAEQLSIPARILAVADVFEALTAGDRPYKKAKSLSQSIDILHEMAQKNHLDMDLVKLLLSSGVYHDYAKYHLKQEQIDTVNLSEYFASQKPIQASVQEQQPPSQATATNTVTTTD
jgi:HD-GYP domain-containing protein (c-di-GMP phosphodiesterase class II)/ABC-type amino acid transport substrate-binding protein